MKLFDSELKVMDVLWRLGDRTAKEISSILGEETGWNVITTGHQGGNPKGGDGGAHRPAFRRLTGPALCVPSQQPDLFAGADWPSPGDRPRNEVR